MYFYIIESLVMKVSTDYINIIITLLFKLVFIVESIH